jgi:hypothetical protein
LLILIIFGGEIQAIACAAGAEKRNVVANKIATANKSALFSTVLECILI